MPLTRKLHRTGNGCAVRIPKPLLEILDLEAGDAVKVSLAGRQIIIEPA